MTAILGIATKFFTCTLAVMYRGKDSNGDLQGGPMYVICEALPRRWHGLAYAFAGLGLLVVGAAVGARRAVAQIKLVNLCA